MIQTILWDNDGILVNTEHLYFRATRESLAAVGVDLTRELYIEYLLEQGTGAWHLAVENGTPPEAIDGLRAERNALYAQFLRQEDTAIDGVEQTLSALHGKVQMGIVTSARPEHFDVIHESTGLLDYVDFVVTSRCFTHYKPHPEPYLIGLERAGCGADECIVIEDSPRGLTAANAAGLRCLVIPTALTRGSDFSSAHRVLGDITQVTLDLLRSI